MDRGTKFAAIWLITVATLVAGSYVACRWAFGASTLTVITKVSPDRRHAARLVTREIGWDVNVFLEVDGDTVYASPDFAAPAEADFQERLMWDSSGMVVVVEVADKRLFGYDVRNQHPLTAAELAAVSLSSFDDLRFTEDPPANSPPRVNR
jgi:hypothetical protein